MKGREHEDIAKALVLLFTILLFASYFFKFELILRVIEYFGYTWIFLGLVLFVLGSILPDSDSKDMGSYIYFKQVFGISYLFKALEFPIAILLGRPRGHRESLHTITGIFLTSLSLILILSFIVNWIGLFELKGAVFGFICLFLGQFLHLVCDIKNGWFFKLK